ncbi:hypothetical protein OsI_16588 [Oryza sativa Indica Group]|uniref:VWFA domain-containing protein n=2 Tax=Oryza sativa TaxID=4530 RepID=B9FG29_ORYSJ|nr:hypothetical protein OsI_16588 [Oryza sativa Indica Group]EEE61313.1 hypothetical protein OsJ_15417 [Oryza sativa Japonica Group]
MYGVGGGGGGFNAPYTASARRRNHEDDDDEEEEESGEGRVLEAWERAYADDRSWEALQEDESGLLRPIDTKTLVHAQYRRRLLLRSAASAAARIQKGLIRYLYIVIDLSRAASEMDYRPSRMAVVAKYAEVFIREFFDQNPLSHVGIVTMKDGISHRLTEIGGSPESQIKALMGKLECSGEPSLQNALELVHGYLDQVPSYGHKEVLFLYSALNTCDPGDIMETIAKCKKSKIRCSVIGLAAEIFICKYLCEETGGSYTVALDESHFKELLLEHAPPPPAIAEYAAANLIKMGFPQRGAEDLISICSCHKKIKSGAEGYICPRCKVNIVNLASMFAVQNATNTSALIAIFTSMRACTIAQVARVSVVLHRDAIVVLIFVFLTQEATRCCKLSRTLTLLSGDEQWRSSCIITYTQHIPGSLHSDESVLPVAIMSTLLKRMDDRQRCQCSFSPVARPSCGHDELQAAAPSCAFSTVDHSSPLERNTGETARRQPIDHGLFRALHSVHTLWR